MGSLFLSRQARIAAAVFSLTLALIAGMLVKHHPHRATLYTFNFNHGAFFSIKTGDTAEHVRATLGEPLSVSIESDLEHWAYSKPVSSPDHTAIRCVCLDPEAQAVTQVESKTKSSYWGHILAGAKLHDK